MENSDQNILDQIAFIRQQITQMGNNDKEMDLINAVIKDFHEKKITGDEALRQANEIKSGKQDTF